MKVYSHRVVIINNNSLVVNERRSWESLSWRGPFLAKGCRRIVLAAWLGSLATPAGALWERGETLQPCSAIDGRELTPVEWYLRSYT